MFEIKKWLGNIQVYTLYVHFDSLKTVFIDCSNKNLDFEF